MLLFADCIPILANIGSFAYGIILGWSAPAAPQILDSNFKFPVTENEFSWVVAVMSLGAAVALLVCGFIRSRLGTKNVILIFGIANFIGWILIIFASNVAMVLNSHLELHDIIILSYFYCFLRSLSPLGSSSGCLVVAIVSTFQFILAKWHRKRFVVLC